MLDYLVDDYRSGTGYLANKPKTVVLTFEL